MPHPWQHKQKRALEAYTLSGQQHVAQYQQTAEDWGRVLLDAGIVVPLFVVLDVGVLIIHPDRWNRVLKPAPNGLGAKEWQTYQQQYWAGLRLIKVILQKYTPLVLPYYETNSRADRAIPFLIITFLYFLKWLRSAEEEGRHQQSVAADVIRHYGELLQWQVAKDQDLTDKEKRQLWNAEEAFLMRVLARDSSLHFDRLLKDPAVVTDFLNAPSLSLAAWHWALETNWRKKKQPFGKDYTTYLDDHFVRKYLNNYSHTYATNLLQNLNIASTSSSILPTRSKRYTSFEEITPFGYSINPTELIYVSDRATEDYFWSRWAEESLLKLDSNTPEENPTEFHINFVLPPLPEMELLTLADDEQLFSSYAKYLTFLIWHDFLWLYIDSGCNLENHFFLTLFLPGVNEQKQLVERPYSAVVEEQWVDGQTPFMINMLWTKGIVSGVDASGPSVFDPFYRLPVEVICQNADQTYAASNGMPFQGSRRGQYWVLFLPKTAVLKATRNRPSTVENTLEIINNSNIATLLKQDDRRYQHAILISFGTVELYRVQYGHQISLLRLSLPTELRKHQEQAIRQLLVDYYLNHILMSALG